MSQCVGVENGWVLIEEPGQSRLVPRFIPIVDVPALFLQALFDQMTELYPHWVANQSWLMFGFPGA
jgi:hypothetical protein